MVEQALERRNSGGRGLRLRRRPSPAPVVEPVAEPVAVVREHPLEPDMSTAQHPYMPMSPCGAECLPEPGAVPTVGYLRRVVRCTVAATVLCGGVLLAASLPVLRGGLRRRMIRSWFGALLRAFGITLRVRGDVSLGDSADGGVLLASTHISWLDVVALNAVQPVRCLAKREIRTWPVIGMLAASAGTVFVDRERLTQLPATVDTMAAVLRDGGKLNVFPEGTTWCGVAGGRWRPAAFQAALDAGAAVLPVSVRYRQRGHGLSAGPSFVGEQTLLDTLGRTLALRGLVIEVDVRPLIRPAPGQTRRTLAAAAQESVAALPDLAAEPVVPRQRKRADRAA